TEKKLDETATLPPDELSRTLIPSAPEDPMDRWRREGEEIAAARRAMKLKMASKPRPAPFDWSEFDERARAVAMNEWSALPKSVGATTGEIFIEERADVRREFEAEVSTLKATIEREREAAAAERSQLREQIGAIERAYARDFAATNRSLSAIENQINQF